MPKEEEIKDPKNQNIMKIKELTVRRKVKRY